MEKFIAVCLWAVQLLQNHTWKNMDFEKDKKKKKKEKSITLHAVGRQRSHLLFHLQPTCPILSTCLIGQEISLPENVYLPHFIGKALWYILDIEVGFQLTT